MSYHIDFTNKAKSDVKEYEKSGDKSTSRKIIVLINELAIHPYSGTGKPEKLKHNLSGLWSSRINKEHRLIYEVQEDLKIISILSLRGHYE